MALLKVVWHGCFAKYTEVGEDREGMRVGGEKEIKRKEHEKKIIS